MGKTPLHEAAEENNAKVAELLIKSGADVQILDKVRLLFLPCIILHYLRDDK